MADIETVVKALECCTTTDEQGFPRCEKCPYADSDGTCQDIDAMHRHALELLKEQEPVKPIRLKNWWKCPSCSGNIVANMKYCPNCEKAVKWDG